MGGTDEAELLARAAELSGRNEFAAVIGLLEGRSLGLELAVQLAKACVNAHAQGTEAGGRDLLECAQHALDACAAAGRHDPQWLLTKGCALFRQGLISDARMRFEQALQHVSAADAAQQQLFALLHGLLRSCAALEHNLQERERCGGQLEAYTAHLQRHFGPLQPLQSLGGVELLQAREVPGRTYQLLFSRGLSCRRHVPPQESGADGGGAAAPCPSAAADAAADGEGPQEEAVELCLALPAAWDAGDHRRLPYQLRMMYDLTAHILGSNAYVGFGFCFDRGQPFDAKTKYQGAMLTAPGDFSPDCAMLRAGRIMINILQIIPLYAAELEYRRHHSAGDLLDLFKLRRVTLSPTIEGRPCVAESARRGGEDAAHGGGAAQ